MRTAFCVFEKGFSRPSKHDQAQYGHISGTNLEKIFNLYK